MRLFKFGVLLVMVAASHPSMALAQEVAPRSDVAAAVDLQAGDVQSATPVASRASGDMQPEPDLSAAMPGVERAYWHVFAAFAATFTLLLGYAISVGRRFGRLEEEVRRLRGR